MGCDGAHRGCGGGSKARSGLRRLLKATRAQERDAMCCLCWRRDRTTTLCIDGHPLHEHWFGARACPSGAHPNKEGVTRWLGLRWYGVPWLGRWWLWLFHKSHPRSVFWEACGCIVPLKDAVVRLRRGLSFLAPTR